MRPTNSPRVHEGLLVERKHAAIALHYRLAPQLEAVCRDAMARIIVHQPQLELLHGKFVFEVKPAGVNKGVAIDAFMHEAPFAGRVPVFAGDDTTDESGFAVVQPRGGIAIKVGCGPEPGAAPARLAACGVRVAGRGARPAWQRRPPRRPPKRTEE